MKITYTNRPQNKQKDAFPSIKSILLMSCVIILMVAIKVMYNPNESIEDVAAMANAPLTRQESDITDVSESTKAP